MPYDGLTLNDLDETLPLEGPGGTKLRELNDAIREDRRCTKNTIGVEHDLSTGKHNFAVFFQKTKTISASAAGTAVIFIENADIPSGKKIYLSGFFLRNNGSAWSSTGALVIQDNNGTPVKFITIPAAALTANTNVWAFKTGISLTEEDAFIYGTGGTIDTGLQIKAGSNGTGGDVTCTVFGIIQ